MHNSYRHFPQKSHRRTRKRVSIGLMPQATQLALIGLPILSLGFCHVTAKLHDHILAGSTGIMLRLGYDIECCIAGLAILAGGVLLLDYMERKQKCDQ